MKSRRVEAAFGGRNPKRKTRLQRVFLFGKSLQSRYFKFWTDRLKSCPPALQGRAAFAAFERFAAGKTSAQKWLCHSEHFNPEGRSGPTGREVHKKGHDVSRVLFCGEPLQFRTHDLQIACAATILFFSTQNILFKIFAFLRPCFWLMSVKNCLNPLLQKQSHSILMFC